MTDPAVSARTLRKARLGEMAGCWLEARCGLCSAMALIPIRLLIRQRGPHVPIGALLPRLTCKRCKVPPAAVWVNETPHRLAAQGVTPGWSVQLIPDGSDDPAWRSSSTLRSGAKPGLTGGVFHVRTIRRPG